MSAYVLIPGAGGHAWYWHRVVPLLQAAGHEAIAVQLPGPDPHAGLAEYANLVVSAIDGRDDVVLVAASIGGFTAPLVAEKVPIRSLVLVNAMIPVPGETPGAWWGNTNSEQARVAAARKGGYSTDFDLSVYFLHDVPPEVLASGTESAVSRGRGGLQVRLRLPGVAGRADPGHGGRRRSLLPGLLPAAGSAGTAGNRRGCSPRGSPDRPRAARATDPLLAPRLSPRAVSLPAGPLSRLPG